MSTPARGLPNKAEVEAQEIEDRALRYLFRNAGDAVEITTPKRNVAGDWVGDVFAAGSPIKLVNWFLRRQARSFPSAPRLSRPYSAMNIALDTERRVIKFSTARHPRHPFTALRASSKRRQPAQPSPTQLCATGHP